MAKVYDEPGIRKNGRNGNGCSPGAASVHDDVAFGYPRDFLGNRFVYLVISPRAGGLSVGINVNPIVNCSFRCVYCEVDRSQPARAAHFDPEQMAAELHETLSVANAGRLRHLPRYARLPESLLQVRQVSLSGDGEPTAASHFVDAVQAAAHVRALGGLPFFKLVLVTNSTGLQRSEVQHALTLFTRTDEVWAKLDGGTQAYMSLVNGASFPIEKILDNILFLGRRRPVVIQSLFPAIDGEEPQEEEIQEYALRLKELKAAGAEIPLVQIYSATRPMARRGCTHLPLKTLSQIARTVRRVSGLRAEVF